MRRCDFDRSRPRDGRPRRHSSRCARPQPRSKKASWRCRSWGSPSALAISPTISTCGRSTASSIKTVQISGIGAMNAVISGSDRLHPVVRQCGDAGGGARTAARSASSSTINRPSVQIVLRKDAGGGLRSQGTRRAARHRRCAARTIAVDAVNSVIHAYVRYPRQARRLRPGRDPHRGAAAAQHAGRAANQADRRLRHGAALGAEAGARRRGRDGRERPGRRSGRPGAVRQHAGRDQARHLREAQGAVRGRRRDLPRGGRPSCSTARTRRWRCSRSGFAQFDDRQLAAAFEDIRKITPRVAAA